MSKLSLTQAAAHVGKSKAALSKAIKTGRMSAVKVGNAYEIDISELTRVYPIKPKSVTDSSPIGLHAISALETEVRMLRETIDREREISDDYRARLDRSEAIIADQRPPKKRKWFWQI